MPEGSNTDAALHRDTTAAFGSMNANNAHLSIQISIRISSSVNQPDVDTPFWHHSLDMSTQEIYFYIGLGNLEVTLIVRRQTGR
jgi:hypothetical protein